MSIETELRTALREEASTASSPETDPYARVSAAVGRNRRHRRVIGAGAVAAVAAIAIGVPAATSRLADGDRALPSGQVHLPAANDTSWRSISTWPIRGELASDTALVQGISEAFEGRPIFVEDLGNTRVALVVREDRLIVATGPLESTAQEMGTGTEGPVSDSATDRVLSLSAGKELVVLTTPDRSSAEVSYAPVIATDGTVTRTWTPLPVVDGVGRSLSATPLTRLRLGAYAGAVQYGFGDGTTTVEQGCEQPCDSDLPIWTELSVTGELARMLAIDPSTIDTKTVFRGAVPNDFSTPGLETSGTSTPRLHLLLSRLAGGQVLRSAVFENGDEDRHLETGRPIDARQENVLPLVSFGAGKSNTGPTTVHVVVPNGTAVRAVGDKPWPSSALVPVRNHVASFEVPVSEDAFDQNYRIEVLDGDRVLSSVRTTRPTQDVFE